MRILASEATIANVDFAAWNKRNRGLVCRAADRSPDGPYDSLLKGCDVMGAVLQPEELYDELANRIAAEDGPGTKRVFRQLLDAGCPRHEVVSHISRLIAQRSPNKTLPSGSKEIHGPKTPAIQPSQIEEHKKPSAWPDTPISNAGDQRLAGSAEKTALNPEIAATQAGSVRRARTSYELSSEPQITAVSEQPEKPLVHQKAAAGPENATRSFEEPRGGFSSEDIVPGQVGVSSGCADFSVLERLASKLKLDRDLSASEAKQAVPTEPVAGRDQPRAAHDSSRIWSRAPGMILTGTAISAVAAAFLVLWGFYGSALEHVNRGPNVSSIADPEKPTEKAGAQQATAVRESDIITPGKTTPATQHDLAVRADTPTEPNTGATSAPGTAEAAENTPRQAESPPWRAAGRAVFPDSTPSRSEQNETDASQPPQTAGSQLPPIDTGALLDQGDQFLSRSDVASARLLYKRAAEAGDGRGALRIGMTFDPVLLARLRLRGVRPDKAQAVAWYRRASALGNAEAEQLLQREVGKLSGGIGAGSGSTPGMLDQHRRPPRIAARGQGHSYRPHRVLASHAKRG